MLLGFENSKTRKRQDNDFAVLTNAQMARADHMAVEMGAKSFDLMLSAGQAIANIVHEHYKDMPVIALCGGGNNGGDGFVAAHFLRDMGHDVTVYALKTGMTAKGDLKKAIKLWDDKSEKLKNFKNDMAVYEDDKRPVIIDAIFGTGFRGSIDPPVSEALDTVCEKNWPVVAADIPSGINGEALTVDAHTLTADYTVTFFRKKKAHVFMPALEKCGNISVHDIGIPRDVLNDMNIECFDNQPPLWLMDMPELKYAGHKYDRGHVVVWGGGEMTGAARLASEAIMRVGAGLCTIVSPKNAAEIYRKAAAHIMVLDVQSISELPEQISDERRNVILIGPGAGRDDDAALKKTVLDVLVSGKRVILDADALSCFEGDPDALLNAMHENCVITPHEGEFARLFPDLEGPRFERAVAASQKTKAVILFKGADSIIVQAGKIPVIHTHAAPYLATAGAGDVLAGMIAGLMAQHKISKLDTFKCVCAAAWAHGEAALEKGVGLVAPDIIDGIPSVLRYLLQEKSRH